MADVIIAPLITHIGLLWILSCFIRIVSRHWTIATVNLVEGWEVLLVVLSLQFLLILGWLIADGLLDVLYYFTRLLLLILVDQRLDDLQAVEDLVKIWLFFVDFEYSIDVRV